MKAKIRKIEYIAFIIVFTLSCFTMSRQRTGGYFYYNNLKFQIFKMTVVFLGVLLITIINRSNCTKTSIYSSAAINFTIVVYTFDYFVTKFSGEISFFRLWWLSTIFVACFAYYTGCHFYKTDDIRFYTRRFWISFTPVYIISFFIIFIRTPSNNLTTNFKIGGGMLKFIPYLAENIGDSEILFNVLGNLLFFIPIPFIIKALFKKIKNYGVILTGALIPFFVEGYQYIFKCGDVDVDDIVVNLCGFLIGLILMKADELIISRIENKNKTETSG